MCDCLDNKDPNSYRWTIKPYGELFIDEEIVGLNTELTENIKTIKPEEASCVSIGEFFWLVDQGDGVLYKIKEFTDTGYILEDDPWTSEGTKI